MLWRFKISLGVRLKTTGEGSVRANSWTVSQIGYFWNTVGNTPFRYSQWPRCLRRRAAAARLLRFWVRIPPGAWMSVVSVVFCQVEVSATSRSLVQRSPTDCGASCVIWKPEKWGRHGTPWAAAPKGGKKRIRHFSITQLMWQADVWQTWREHFPAIERAREIAFISVFQSIV